MTDKNDEKKSSSPKDNEISPKNLAGNDDNHKKKKIKELNDKLLRALAESENLRKNHEKEKEDIIKFGASTFALQILALTDNLHRAFNIFKQNDKFKTAEFKEILEGVEIIEKDLESTLKQNNINYIKCLGLKFDPNFHQAVGQKESDKEEGTIIEEVQKGYTLYERLLRPSMVYVAKNPKK